MKAMADRLGDLGSPITNNDLIQNIIRGLNPQPSSLHSSPHPSQVASFISQGALHALT
jgi:hypothetical protein